MISMRHGQFLLIYACSHMHKYCKFTVDEPTPFSKSIIKMKEWGATGMQSAIQPFILNILLFPQV